MPKISLTTFVDFVSKSGTTRLTCVRKAKGLYQQEYEPAFDFWKPLRDAIVEMHKHNRPKDTLGNVLAGLTDKNKRNLYPSRIRAYKRWVGRKTIQWAGCDPEIWQHGSLLVRVNPELGVSINGSKYIIKLYFKEECLSKNRVDTMLFLIQSTFSRNHPNATPGILDVPRGKLIRPTRNISDIDALLEGEAAAFIQMWNRV